MFTALPETFTGRSDSAATISHSLSLFLAAFFLFLSDISTSTLWSVYLSEATTQQVLLLSKSKSGGCIGDKFPDEHAGGHTQENVNWAWSISDNK